MRTSKLEGARTIVSARARQVATQPAGPFSGAVTRGAILYIATIGNDGTGRRRLIASLSGEIRLEGRDQVDLALFDAKLHRFLRRHNLQQLTLVTSPKTGPQMATAFAYKIEAACQLAPIVIDLVDASVSRHGANQGHGNGFRPIFERLADMTGQLRFISGNYALSLDGRFDDQIGRQLAQKPRLSGFFAAVNCGVR